MKKNRFTETHIVEILRISVPLLAEFKAWITQELPTLNPKSPIAHALAYHLKHWDELSIYTTEGSL